MKALLLLLAVLSLPARAAYDFPLQDPYYATITAALLKANEADKSVTYRQVVVSPIPERDDVPYYGGGQNRLKLRYWFAPGFSGPAPLVVMIAGVGGGEGSAYYNFLAYAFVKQGFRVMVVPSPMNFSFALTSSTSGYPGYTKADADDLYRVMQLGVARAEKALKHVHSSVGLVGVSLGALEGAYVGQLDARENKLGFSRTLLINPPIDPLYSIGVLDAMNAKGKSILEARKKEISMSSIQLGLSTLIMTPITSPSYFGELEKRLPTTTDERQYIIGSSLQVFLPSLLFTTQQVRDIKIFKNDQATVDPEPRLKEAENFTFSDYIEKFLLPALSADAGKPLSYADILPQTAMQGAEEYLRSDSRVLLFHNEDDPIINADQLAWLRGVMREKLTVFPHGGHVGNIWYPENLKAILSAFSNLK
jgi:pimeloyl-ACP methyl ester carboxylesterase